MFLLVAPNVNVLLSLKVYSRRENLKKTEFVKLSVPLVKIFHPKLQI